MRSKRNLILRFGHSSSTRTERCWQFFYSVCCEEGKTCNYNNLGEKILSDVKTDAVRRDPDFKITFYGRSGQRTKDFRHSKIMKNVTEYFKDDMDKVISFPTPCYIPKPANVGILDRFTKNKKDKFLADYLELQLHTQLTNSLRNLNVIGLIFMGWYTSYQLNPHLSSSKSSKKSNKPYELNQHDLNLMKYLKLEDLTDPEWQECLALHREVWKDVKEMDLEEFNNKFNPIISDSEGSWIRREMLKVLRLMKKENKNLQYIDKMNDEDLHEFYRHQKYSLQVKQHSFEMDSLVILPESKLILHFEIKSGKTVDAFQSAVNQTNNGFQFFKKIFGPKLSPGWKYLCIACCPFLEKNINCQFVIRSRSLHNIHLWIQELVNTSQKFSQEEYKKDYEWLLQNIVGHASLVEIKNKLFFGLQDATLKTEELLIGTKKGVTTEMEKKHSEESMEHLCQPSFFMMTMEQMEVRQNHGRFIILEGDYGTGKTYLLKHLAMDKAKNKNCSIIYISMTGEVEHNSTFLSHSEYSHKTGHGTLMDIWTQMEFSEEESDNLEVMEIGDLVALHNKYRKNPHETHPNIGELLSVLLTQNTKDDVHIFIDEIPPMPYDITGLQTFLKKGTLCMTVKRLEEKSKDNDKEFQKEKMQEHNCFVRSFLHNSASLDL